VAALGVEAQTQVFSGAGHALLRRLGQEGRTFSIIYLDPPYRFKVEALLAEIDALGLLDQEGVLFLERGLDANPPPESYASFTLRQSKTMGSSVLYQYVGKGESA
jgi:16S rRNA (guanine966-N2)-methyltransferase